MCRFESCQMHHSLACAFSVVHNRKLLEVRVLPIGSTRTPPKMARQRRSVRSSLCRYKRRSLEPEFKGSSPFSAVHGDVRPAARMPECDPGDVGSTPTHPPTCRTGRAARPTSAKRRGAGANPACDSTRKGQPIGDGSAVLTRRAMSLAGSTPAPSANDDELGTRD
jgi:hypothetical protein